MARTLPLPVGQAYITLVNTSIPAELMELAWRAPCPGERPWPRTSCCGRCTSDHDVGHRAPGHSGKPTVAANATTPVLTPQPMSTLILKRASASRRMTTTMCSPDGVVVGRIMKAAAKPADASWLWTWGYGYHEDRTPTHGYEPTREAADGGVQEELAEGVKLGQSRSQFSGR